MQEKNLFFFFEHAFLCESVIFVNESSTSGANPLLLFRGDYILANTCGAFYGGGGMLQQLSLDLKKMFPQRNRLLLSEHPLYEKVVCVL